MYHKRLKLWQSTLIYYTKHRSNKHELLWKQQVFAQRVKYTWLSRVYSWYATYYFVTHSWVLIAVLYYSYIPPLPFEVKACIYMHIYVTGSAHGRKSKFLYRLNDTSIQYQAALCGLVLVAAFPQPTGDPYEFPLPSQHIVSVWAYLVLDSYCPTCEKCKQHDYHSYAYLVVSC